jgi:hypothetical protein
MLLGVEMDLCTIYYIETENSIRLSGRAHEDETDRREYSDLLGSCSF